ncbi:MAG: HD domain-containing protein [Myxococcota bacterium]
MKARLLQVLETLFVWTVGPVILFFSPRARRFRRVTLATAALGATAWWTGFALWFLGTLVGMIPETSLGGDLTTLERGAAVRALHEFVQPGSATDLHSLRMEERALRFASAEGAHVGAVRTAALLHDALKDNLPKVSPKDRYCMHGETGALNSIRAIKHRLSDRSVAFSVVVADAIFRHMGPCGFNMDWRDRRHVSKTCDRDYPTPVSRVSQVVYDLDMLDQMTVEGVLRLVEQRQATSDEATGKESLKDMVKTGKDSAWKQVVDAGQTLRTRTGQRCGKELQSDTVGFIKSLDFGRVKSLEDLRGAAAAWRVGHPEPTCWAAQDRGSGTG